MTPGTTGMAYHAGIDTDLEIIENHFLEGRLLVTNQPMVLPELHGEPRSGRLIGLLGMRRRA